jgi:hypothetical protein
MIPDGQYTAVVDRIEDGLAAVLVEEEGTDAYELLVEPSELPEEAQNADAVLTVEVQDGDLAEARYEANETAERRETAQNRFDRLSERPTSDDNERDK